MASTTNTFNLLKPGQEAPLDPKKAKKRSKKKGVGKVEVAGDVETVARGSVAPPPTGHELEDKARGEDLMGLLAAWSGDLEADKGWVDQQGRPVSLRGLLLSCKALEVVTEEVLKDYGEEQEEGLGRLLSLVFQYTDDGVISQLMAAAGRVVSVLGSGELFGNGRRCVVELVGSVKRAEVVAEDSEEGKWSNRGKAKVDKANAGKADRKPGRGESRSDYELSLALEELKASQSELDEVRQDFSSASELARSVTTGASQSIADLRTLMSMARQSQDGFNDVPKKKGKKGKEKAPGVQAQGGNNSNQGFVQAAMAPFNKEAEALAEQELQLSQEIAGFETKLTSLKSQLSAIKDAQLQLQQRKAVITNSAMPVSGVPLIPQRDQAQIVGLMEEVVSELQGVCSMSNAEKNAVVSAYVDSASKALQSVHSKLEEVMKNVKFLRDAIHRKIQHEEQYLSMAAGETRKDLLSNNRKQQKNLEGQLQEALQVALNLLQKAENILQYSNIRKDVVGEAIHSIQELGTSISALHQEIVQESIIKVKAREPAPVAAPPTRKRFDASEIVKQAELEVAQEMSRGRRGPPNQNPNHQSRQQKASTPQTGREQGHTPHQTSTQPISKPVSAVAPPQPYMSPGQAQGRQPMEAMEPVSRVVGFGPGSGPVRIPSTEDEMVPPPVSDRMDGHFPPTVIGNGSHSQGPIAPPVSKVVSPQIPAMGGMPPMVQPVANNSGMGSDAPPTYAAPRGWKKIDHATGEPGALSSDPTPAEAMKFAKSNK